MPLYVRTPGEGAGNAALVAHGALPFTLTADSTDTLIGLFGARVVDQSPSDSDIAAVQQSFLAPESVASTEATPTQSPPFSVQEEPSAPPRPEAAVQPAMATELLVVSASGDSVDATGTVKEPLAAEQTAPVGSGSTLDMYADFSAKLASLLSGGALSEEEISTLLCIEKAQSKVWLRRASEAGLIEKLKKPVRYSMGNQGSLC